MATTGNIIQGDDSAIKRNRGRRFAVFIMSAVALTGLGALLAGYLAQTFLGAGPFYWIGFVLGALLGFVSFLAIKHLFVVKNDTIGALVNLDQLQSFLGNKDVHVVYGPGSHFAYPWEARFAENNIPLKEVAEEFTFPVVCKDGTLTVFASFRIRPDFNNLLAYLSGVGAAAQDFKALQIAFITKKLTAKTMQVAKDEQGQLNDELVIEFVSGHTPFEERFGVQTGDVTVSNMLMSDEAQRTRSGLNEAAAIAQGTAVLLGFETVQQMKRALATGKITQADIDRGRREFRIISGNMDNSQVNRYEVDITGLTPEVAAALSSFLNTPAGRAFAAGKQGGKQQPKKGTT